MRFLRNWKKVLRLCSAGYFGWLLLHVFKNLYIASVIGSVRIYSIALYFSCHDFCEKMFSFTVLSDLQQITHILFWFVYNWLMLCKVIHLDFEDGGFPMCWNHFESISGRYSLSCHCFLLTASEPSWIAKQSMSCISPKLYSAPAWASWKQKQQWALGAETCWISGGISGAFGLLTSNDSSLADCEGAGDTIEAKSSQSEGR